MNLHGIRDAGEAGGWQRAKILWLIMEAVFPTRGRNWRRSGPRQRHRTTPITFAEIKEVDEEKENEEVCGTSVGCIASEAVQRHPELEREFAEFRRRRARRGPEHAGDGNAAAAGVTAIPSSGSPVQSTVYSEPPTAAPS